MSFFSAKIKNIVLILCLQEPFEVSSCMLTLMSAQALMAYFHFAEFSKPGSMNPSSLFLCKIVVMAILGPLHFHINLEVNLSVSEKKNGNGKLEMLFDLYINLENISILTILNFTKHKYPSIY